MSERKRRTSSSTVALSTATLFLMAAALVSFITDDGTGIASSWSLRGTIPPGTETPHGGA